jgi:hypothetical protein
MFGNPPGPPRPGGGPPSLVNGQGYVHTYVPGMGYRPATHFGIPIRDMSPGGIPRMAPSIGPRQPERMIGGLPITGPGGQPLFRRGPR